MLPGVNELIITGVVIALLFGATKVPKVVKYTGKTMHEYKKGQKEGEEGLRQIEHRIKEIEEQDKKKTSDMLPFLNLNLNNVLNRAVNKENALMALGLIILAAGSLLILGEQLLSETTTGVAISLVVLGIVLIAIRKKI